MHYWFSTLPCQTIVSGELRDVMANVVIYWAFCLDVAQGLMKGVPNETRTHSCRFASRAC